jgi:tetratricopeptide (TPR) repeat protein
LKITTEPAAPPTQQSLIAELTDLGFKYIRDKDYSSAQFAFKKVLELDNKDVSARFVYAILIDDQTHKKQAEARDLILSILDENPAIFDHPTDINLKMIRAAAERCCNVGPFTRAIDLCRKLAHASNSASDYRRLSEVLIQGNFFEESISSLEKAIALDPATYDTKANRETLQIAGSRLNQTISGAANGRKKIGRYPETKDFLGDFQRLIKDHIAVNLNSEPKFLNRNVRFFTMGSCFARNLAESFSARGYVSRHMEISEHINTTFANKVFVDWLSDVEIDGPIGDRFAELLPAHSGKEDALQAIKNSDVFILTLGVAAAFFDRATGDFVLPRSSGLNSRALAEKYLFRTTSVKENVENVLYLIESIRKISPDVRFVVTVSPVPSLASFEYESAVQADCLSKSTMRLVAHEVVNNSNISNILYWPSFEIFRWAGSNASNYYAADDGAAWHVSEEKVAGTIRAFEEMFSPA